MKSEEGKAWPFASRGVDVDIQPVIIETLRAAVELSRPFGSAYFNMFLRGVSNNQYMKGNHDTLPCFGTLNGLPRDMITRVFHYMVDEGLMKPSNESFSAFTISEKGHKFLEAPETRYVHHTYLKFSAKESFMYRKLREFRKELATHLDLPEYQLFTDYTLDRIVMRLPLNAEQLLQMPGLNPFKLDMFGSGLLDLLSDATEEYRQIAQRRQNYFNSKPDHQYVKRLMEDGRPFAEISKAMTYEYGKVENILMDLAATKEANVIPWIEAQVQSKALFRATEYFRKAKTKSVGTARETLNLDQVTLHLCRLWVKVMEQEGVAMKQAS